MIIFAGALLLVLGLVSGRFLLLAPFGIGPATPGGYVLARIGARSK